ncbi:MAG: hypothetical protein WBV82_17535 [Myxococcaceae bacterium]
MGAWVKMSMLVAVAVLPGGLLFLLVWALTRAFRTSLRNASNPTGRIDLLKVLSGISLRDVWREARAMSGWSHPAPHH